MSKSLESLISKLAETLEDKPDPWFNNPQGWLSKPDYKRPAQDRANVNDQLKPKFFDRMMKSPYNKRWFVLNTQTRALRYFKDEEHFQAENESGSIDLSKVVKVAFSKVYDAPEFSLDLISLDRHFTVVAESHSQMIRWAYAFNISVIDAPKKNAPKTSSNNTNQKVGLATDKWQRFDFTYDTPGPLRLNVMGSCIRNRKGDVLNNWIKVTSFELCSNGTPGRSELSGMISVNDYIVGVNGVDLTSQSFNDSMEVIGNSTWPKTIHFLRDDAASKVSNRVEGWLNVNYPALNRIRRRYGEIRNDAIHFRKPAPGGAAMNQRDSYFLLSSIDFIKPIHDKTLPLDQQYVLRINCKADSTVEQVDENDRSLGGTRVEILELYFPSENLLNSWRSCIVSPTELSSSGSIVPIQVMAKEVIELSSQDELTTNFGDLAIKSPLTGQFSVRDVNISQGYLKWNRVTANRSTNSSNTKKTERSVFLCNSINCELRAVRALNDTNLLNTKKENFYQYQLSITTISQTIVIGMKSEVTIKSWLVKLREMVSLSPLSGGVVISEGVEKGSTIGNEADNDFQDTFQGIPGMNISGDDENSIVVKGYLYSKKSERAGNGKLDFQKKWFVMQDFQMTSYKSPSEARTQSLSLGRIDLRSVLEVKECVDEHAPENSFEIVTNMMGTQNQPIVHLLVAEDEEELYRWIDSISDILDLRYAIVPGSLDDKSEMGDKDRRKALQDAVLYSGRLLMKRLNRLTQTTTWRDRFIVIVAGTVYYYENENDYYDVEKDCTGEIPVVAIMHVETSVDPKCTAGCGFDIQARVQEGGDSSGIRAYVFEAPSIAIAKEWMEKLCQATNCLTLKEKPGGLGYESVLNDQKVSQQQNQKLKNVMQFASGERRGSSTMHTAGAADTSGTSDGNYSSGDSGARSAASSDSPVANRSNPLFGRGGGRGGGRPIARRTSASNANTIANSNANSNASSPLVLNAPSNEHTTAPEVEQVTSQMEEVDLSPSSPLPSTPPPSVPYNSHPFSNDDHKQEEGIENSEYDSSELHEISIESDGETESQVGNSYSSNEFSSDAMRKSPGYNISPSQHGLPKSFTQNTIFAKGRGMSNDRNFTGRGGRGGRGNAYIAPGNI